MRVGVGYRSGIARTTIVVVIVAVIIVAAASYYFLGTSAPAPPKPITNVRFAAGYTVWNVLEVTLWAAQNFGFFHKEGVNATWVLVSGGPLAVKALSAGDADFAWGAPGAHVGAIDQGAQFRVVVSSNTGTGYELVSNKKVSNTPASIKGTNWGVESIGGASYEVDVEYLKGVGLTANDVNWVTVGSPALRLQALVAQKIDVAALSIDTAYTALTYNYLQVLADTATLSKYVVSPTGYISASQQMIQNHPDVVEGIVKGYIEACRALSTNETLFEQSLNSMQPGVFNKTVTDSFYPLLKTYWAVNGALNQGTVQGYLNVYFTLLNPTAKPIGMNDTVDYAFVKQALNSLGTSPATWDPVDYSTK